MNRKRFVILALVLLFSIPSLAQTGTKKKRPLPYEYGRVVLNNNATKYEMAPVVFEHWIHQSMFTCRVCHVDVGFGIRPAQPASGPRILSAVITAAPATTAVPSKTASPSLPPVPTRS